MAANPDVSLLPPAESCLRKEIAHYKTTRHLLWAELQNVPELSSAKVAHYAQAKSASSRDVDEAWIDVFRDNPEVVTATGVPVALLDRLQKADAGLCSMETAALSAANQITDNIRYLRLTTYVLNGKVQYAVSSLTQDEERPLGLRKLIEVAWTPIYKEEELEQSRGTNARKQTEKTQTWLSQKLAELADSAEERAAVERLLLHAQNETNSQTLLS